MNQKLQTLNIFVVFTVIVYSILIQSLIQQSIDNLYLSYLINFLTSIGFYKLLLFIIYSFINKSDLFLKLYWNRLYLQGFWSYTYTLQGITYRGLWRIEQDLFGVKVVGFGIDENGKPRSDVRSVSNLIERTHAYEIINLRKDRIQLNQENYSKTTLYPDFNPKNHIFRVAYPVRMRATTVIYGGELSGRIHEDVVFIKNEKAVCEEDVINTLLTAKIC